MPTTNRIARPTLSAASAALTSIHIPPRPRRSPPSTVRSMAAPMKKFSTNVDFYRGFIYQSMGFPMTMSPVLFAIPRTSGGIAQGEEMLLDPEQKIARPRQIYLGHDTRHYVPIDQRS